MTLPLRELDSVVLLKDHPHAGPRAGDIGAVVQVYGKDAVEVRFVTAAGRTVAIETLEVEDVRAVGDGEVTMPLPGTKGTS